MLLKLAALGALGYAGYRYYQKNMDGRRNGTGASAATPSSAPDVSDPRVAMAGGPLSEQASVVEAGQPLPAT